MPSRLLLMNNILLPCSQRHFTITPRLRGSNQSVRRSNCRRCRRAEKRLSHLATTQTLLGKREAQFPVDLVRLERLTRHIRMCAVNSSCMQFEYSIDSCVAEFDQETDVKPKRIFRM